jgi:hypothetical protein
MTVYSESREQGSKLLFPTLEVIYKTDSVCLQVPLVVDGLILDLSLT